MFQFLKCLYQTKVPSLLWRKFNSKYSTLLTNIQMLKDVTHTESNAIVWFPEISGYVNWRCGFLCQMKHIITINCLTYKTSATIGKMIFLLKKVPKQYSAKKYRNISMNISQSDEGKQNHRGHYKSKPIIINLTRSKVKAYSLVLLPIWSAAAAE